MQPKNAHLWSSWIVSLAKIEAKSIFHSEYTLNSDYNRVNPYFKYMISFCLK